MVKKKKFGKETVVKHYLVTVVTARADKIASSGTLIIRDRISGYLTRGVRRNRDRNGVSRGGPGTGVGRDSST